MGYIDLNIPLILILCLFIDWKLYSKNPNKWVTWNNKEKIKNVIKRKQQEALGDTMPTPGDTMLLVAHRLATPGHCQATQTSFQHCFRGCTWRWEASARHHFHWCGKLAIFLLFSQGETHLGRFGARATRFGALGGLLGLVRTIPFSSLYLFPLSLSFCKFGFSMTMES